MKNIRIIVPVALGLMLCSLILGCGSNATGGGGGGGAAATIYVSTTGHDDTGEGTAAKPYRTIQKGLDVVGAGGLVSVDAGVYTENLTWPSKESITLSGAAMGLTTLDANNIDRGIIIQYYSSFHVIKSARVEKMTITKGHIINNGGGGGIMFDYAHSTLHLYEVMISSCSIESATAAFGGGLNVHDSNYNNATLEAIKCSIINNRAMGDASAAGIYCGAASISSCEISGNYTAGGGAGLFMEGPGMRIENSVIHHNVSDGYWGGGVYTNSDSNLVIINCTIASNEANNATYGKGGGIACSNGNNSIVNCIIYGNTAAAASNEVWLNPGLLGFSVTYSDIRGGYTGTGNVDEDPVFNNPANNFHLTSFITTPSDVYEGGTKEGAPVCDYDGNTRTQPYSMGAYEKDHP